MIVPDGTRRGRPSSFRAEFVRVAFGLTVLGATDKHLAAALEISEATLNIWKQKHPQFLESIRKGKIHADGQVAESLFRRACGITHKTKKLFQHKGVVTEREVEEYYPPDAAACLFWLKNRQRALWGGKTVGQCDRGNSSSAARGMGTGRDPSGIGAANRCCHPGFHPNP